MMRYLTIIFFSVLIFAACVKTKSNNPLPIIEYQDFKAWQVTNSVGIKRDTAFLSIGYEDGDGDLFVDRSDQGPNIFITPYYYNATSGKFQAELTTFPNGIKDTFRITNVVMQPDNGYYRGKSIKGGIIIPMSEFRFSNENRIFKYNIFMNDLKSHKSNVITSPVYTLNF